MPLTILIWIYAEREQSDTQKNIVFPIEVRIADGNRLVTLKDPPDRNVITTLSGPRTVLDRFIRDLMAGGPDHAAVQIYIEPGSKKGEHTYQTAQLLANNSLFTRQGISVKEVAPAALRVDVDDFEVRSVDVHPPESLSSVKDVRFIPTQVKVRAPISTWKLAEDARKLYVVADLSKLEALGQPGVHDIPAVPLIWPNANALDQVTLDPRTVRATFEVQHLEEKALLGSVTVFVKGPPSFFDKYTVNLKLPGNANTLSQVPVAGPRDKLEALKAGDLPAAAVLLVTTNDLPVDMETKKRVQFDLPAGVRFDGDPDKFQVPFTITVKNP